ncbi:hypothetical protein QBC46DRAFT_374313 [Diplogelasinospora grovesii]|uniref:Cytidyltransferase-like domain-containing protein n=1 Tax=Diplogelasinospora grovesii TaxID=303347 RepID=A0AAN6S8I9_9PEZI|nr:hypothetical protein QBC46DRAFT_374313 [Diplogelasinospora grovesii]
MPTPPLPPLIERSLHAQSLLPAGRPLVDFFSRSLTSFQSSNSKFHVVCTVPSSSQPVTGYGQQIQNRIIALPTPLPPSTKPRALVVLDSSFNPPTIAHLRMATSAIHDLNQRDRLGPGALRLLLLLAINNADKAPKPAAFDQRLAMMWAFAQDIQQSLEDEKWNNTRSDKDVTEEEQDSYLSIDVALTTQPYFHDKSAAIAESAFYRPGGGSEENGEALEQIFLVGYDTLIRIFDPKYYGPPASTGGDSSTGDMPMQKALGPFFARAKLRVTMRTDADWGGEDDQAAHLADLLSTEGMKRIGGCSDWVARIEVVEGRKRGEGIVSSTVARKAAANHDWNTLDKIVPPEVRKWVRREKLYSAE